MGLSSMAMAGLVALATGCAMEEEALDDEFADGVTEALEDEFADGVDGDDPFRALTSFPGISASQLCTGTLYDGIGIMRYCRNRSVYSDNSNVTRSIILVHGSNLNGKDYYDWTMDEAILEGVDLTKTDIISMQFFYRRLGDQASIDLEQEWDDANYYTWGQDWRVGGAARSHSRSTFDMVDHVVGQLMDHRPNLDQIVIAGQSAGGQFVDRYMPTTDEDTTGVDVRYWAANPYAYLYLTDDRPISPVGCADYNEWSAGFDDKASWPYIAGGSVATFRNNAVSRDMYWTVGANDFGAVTTSCKSTVQGANRNDRWDKHRDHIGDLCTDEGFNWFYCLLHTARHIEIPGVGHGFEGSVESTEGHEILFD